MERAECADAVCDEVWAVLGSDHTFAESLIEKAKQETGNFGFRPFGANYFNQMEVTRRVEEVNADEVRTEIFRATLCKKANGNTTCV